MVKISINELAVSEERKPTTAKAGLQRIRNLLESRERKAARKVVGAKVKSKNKKLGWKKMKKIEKTELEILRESQDRLLTHIIIGYIVDIALILFLVTKG